MVNQLTNAWIALGSNATSSWGEPADTVIAAAQRLQSDSCDVVRRSHLFTTPAFPADSGPDFVNAAIGVQTGLDARALLKHLHSVEISMGRVREERWGPRTIDLDLLAFGDLVLPDAGTQATWRALSLEEQMAQAPDELILPHPRLQDRAFVLVPLAEIAGDWKHPMLGKTVSEMLAACPDAEKSAIVPMETGF